MKLIGSLTSPYVRKVLACMNLKGLAYEVDPQKGTVIIKIVDQATQEVIREIPSEDVQRMNRAMDEMLGRLLDRKG